jgi:hypothetical protein
MCFRMVRLVEKNDLAFCNLRDHECDLVHCEHGFRLSKIRIACEHHERHSFRTGGSFRAPPGM